MLHGIMAGSDSGTLTMQALYLITGASILFATYFRIFTAKTQR